MKKNLIFILIDGLGFKQFKLANKNTNLTNSINKFQNLGLNYK